MELRTFLYHFDSSSFQVQDDPWFEMLDAMWLDVKMKLVLHARRNINPLLAECNCSNETEHGSRRQKEGLLWNKNHCSGRALAKPRHDSLQRSKTKAPNYSRIHVGYPVPP
ncbi:hypothetical protein M513_07305 [Trichuris suis]|uniref:Uncharacterized protein n=1 Tax=Trichuris suis TaxID=68888 RepID=A0A085M3I2_9BILA|nr:hypothetical protein M513_07305 [Trichuris suis]